MDVPVCYLSMLHPAASAMCCSLCKLVQHVGNPADCSSVERCILAYLVELYTTSADVKEKYSTLFSGAESKVKSALFIKTLTPTLANLMWDKRVLLEVLDNPKKSLQYDVYQFLKAKFVCSSLALSFRSKFEGLWSVVLLQVSTGSVDHRSVARPGLPLQLRLQHHHHGCEEHA